MSLRLRIFISMILLVFTAILLVLGSTYYQYRTESDQYNSYRQERKESQLKRQINYIVNKYDLSNNYDKWDDYANDFEEITKIHSVEYSIFTIEGSTLFYSYLPLEVISNNYSLDIDFAKMLVSNEEGKFTSENFTDVGKFQSSYSVLKSDAGEKYAILFFPYFQDVSFAESELNVFLSTLYQIYFIMLVVAIVLAYFISRFVTRSIETIRLKIGQTGLLKKNEKIYLNNATKEIDSLVNSYNKMIDDLEDSAQRLAKTEREQAWQEMAKQVAHEIKNPLTPMKLSIQHILHKMESDDVNAQELIKTALPNLIDQIDALARMANEFARFAKLPEPIFEKIELNTFITQTVQLFDEEQNLIHFNASNDTIWIQFDKDMLSQVFNNLLLNAKQATETKLDKRIDIVVSSSDTHILIQFKDNGVGIIKSEYEKIFTPHFTTKSSGSGIGLSVVRQIIEKHEGKIWFESARNKGSIFFLEFKRLNEN